MSFVGIRKIDVSRQPLWWYHSMDFPDGTAVIGDWDLRGRFGDYTGNVEIGGKRVLDVGTASGFLAFGAEKMGARVVAFDMPISGNWDTVPYADTPVSGLSEDKIAGHMKARRLSEKTRYKREDGIRPMRNAFFHAHQKYSSHVRLFEGSVYDLDETVGIFDVAFVGAIMLHLRDPFLALHRIAQITTKTLVISDLCSTWFKSESGDQALMRFLPDTEKVNNHAWWEFSPKALEAMLHVVGFKVSTTTIKSYKFQGKDHEFVTIVAERFAA